MKIGRLQGKFAVSELFSAGVFARGRFVSVRLKKTENPVRAAAISPKRLGCAVKRNRARRLIRAALREISGELPEADLAVIAGPLCVGVSAPDFEKLVDDIGRTIAKAARKSK